MTASEIAKSLTPAQGRRLIEVGRLHGARTFGGMQINVDLDVLKDFALLTLDKFYPMGFVLMSWRITPLGLAVRDELEDKASE